MASKKELLQELCGVYGYESVMDMLEAASFDSICPAICPTCLSTEDMEPDQYRGWCGECEKNTMVSALVLAGII